AASQGILGILPDYDGLRIEPCLPASIKNLKITRKFRGAVYNVTVKNTGKGAHKLTVDGNEVDGYVIPFEDGKKVYKVSVEM
ncbi:MAG: cellobiose phosphorylase, partial [Ruminococcaceae bacterium]|nr:cellobiose phosphorylase [Oscillospiraceae bacterium]